VSGSNSRGRAMAVSQLVSKLFCTLQFRMPWHNGGFTG
jgi:hypothetical protein